MSELLPCPFCGGGVALYFPTELSLADFLPVICCHHCGVSVERTNLSPDEDDLVAAWNRRSIPTIPHHGVINEPRPSLADVDPLSR